MNKNAQAFSLIEVIIAMTCASVVIASATMATKMLYRQVVAMEQQASAHDDAKVLLDVMVSDVVQAGGGNIRPWQALSPSCATSGFGGLGTCAGQTDQIHIGQIALGTQLTIAAGGYTGTGNATVQTVGGTCPMTTADGYPATGRTVLLFPKTPKSGGGWQMKRCVPFTTGCGCTLTDITNAVTVSPGAALVTADWSGGVIAPGQTLSYYVNPTTRELRVHADVDDDNVVDDRLMDTDIYDLQVQFGFDEAPVDGAFDGTWRETIAATSAGSLRMARVGAVVGAFSASRERASTVRLFGAVSTGPNNVYLVPASGAVALRNLLVFF